MLSLHLPSCNLLEMFILKSKPSCKKNLMETQEMLLCLQYTQLFRGKEGLSVWLQILTWLTVKNACLQSSAVIISLNIPHKHFYCILYTSCEERMWSSLSLMYWGLLWKVSKIQEQWCRKKAMSWCKRKQIASRWDIAWTEQSFLLPK